MRISNTVLVMSPKYTKAPEFHLYDSTGNFLSPSHLKPLEYLE